MRQRDIQWPKVNIRRLPIVEHIVQILAVQGGRHAEHVRVGPACEGGVDEVRVALDHGVGLEESLAALRVVVAGDYERLGGFGVVV